ncbi:hypothetical protein GDO86_020385 [Hymenochirus boettgeri]|uniref:Ermin n=1 Tax=Hymenochirus boettgeri TaxID=247094 RepID=A0A8T2IHL5_9PIPI|nr:hypothetical protein GDO86_020385 [Hymenochirus boettgeri]
MADETRILDPNDDLPLEVKLIHITDVPDDMADEEVECGTLGNDCELPVPIEDHHPRNDTDEDKATQGSDNITAGDINENTNFTEHGRSSAELKDLLPSDPAIDHSVDHLTCPTDDMEDEIISTECGSENGKESFTDEQEYGSKHSMSLSPTGSHQELPDGLSVGGGRPDILKHSYSRYDTVSYRKIRKGNTKQRIDEFESMMNL